MFVNCYLIQICYPHMNFFQRTIPKSTFSNLRNSLGNHNSFNRLIFNATNGFATIRIFQHIIHTDYMFYICKFINI